MDIALKGVTKTYRGGTRALTGVDLHVSSGVVGLLGTNGAGKTTLMRIMAGIVRPTDGSVRIGGHDMMSSQGRTAVQKALGYLPQELGVYPDLSAREFLDYIAILKGMDDRLSRHGRVDELLDTVGLADVASRRLKTYSGGMKRRVGIAQALLNRPRLLIADEPTAGLDPEERLRFRNLLVSISEGRTVLLSTHIVEDVAHTCAELVVLGLGETIFRGTSEELAALAAGRAWSFVAGTPLSLDHLIVVSALQVAEGVQYRAVADAIPCEGAVAVAPSVEDGYVALMRQHRLPSARPRALPLGRAGTRRHRRAW